MNSFLSNLVLHLQVRFNMSMKEEGDYMEMTGSVLSWFFHISFLLKDFTVRT